MGEIRALGEVRWKGKTGGGADGSLFAAINLGPTLEARLECPSIRARAELNGTVELGSLPELLPASLPAMEKLRGASGRAEIRAGVAYRRGKIEITRFDLGLPDATLTPAAAASTV